LLILILALLPLSSGCASMIAHCGEDFADLKTREDVQEHFGGRITSGVEDGRPFDEIHYHGKVCQSGDCGKCYTKLLIMTCGLIDLVMVPYETCRAARCIIPGHAIRFHYDESNRLTSHTVDGDIPYAVSQSPHRTRPETPAAADA